MYKELREVESGAETASTPDMWAANFAASGRLTPWRAFRLRRQTEARLLRKFINPGGRVLDAGCGFGEYVRLLRQLGFNATGLDYSRTLVERLRIEYPEDEWHHGDIRHMPFESGSFDAVISWGVIEHDEAGPHAALTEFARVVKPGGVVIVTVPFDTPRQRHSSQQQFPERDKPRTFFQYMMTVDELREHVRKAGLEPVAADTTRAASLELFWRNAPFRGPVRAVASIGAGILLKPTRRFDGMIYCVGRKP